MMEFFNKTKAVKLRGSHDKYLVADDDKETVRQSRNGSSRRARWLVESVDGDPRAIRLRSCHGGYLVSSDVPFLLGMTGNRVVQGKQGEVHDGLTHWEPVRDGFQVKLRAFGGTFLRANGGMPPWRNSVTHDQPHVGSTQQWILWEVESVDVPENEGLTDYLSMMSNVSSVSDDVWDESGNLSPISVQSFNSPRFSALSINSPSFAKKRGMDLFANAKAVRLRSHHGKYLHAEGDEESVSQSRKASSKNTHWSVEPVPGSDSLIRLKSCYGKYLTASNQPFLLGMTGRKVLQTKPAGRLDSSFEWEPIGNEKSQVKLRTRYGHFLRANGGLPPWRNSVTHDIPNRTATQDWILWEVDVVEIVNGSPHPKGDAGQVRSVQHLDSFASDSSQSSKSHSFGGQESSDSVVSSPPKAMDGRTIYYHIADAYGNVDETAEELSITFKENGVEELTKKLEEELGLEDITVCSRSPLNNKLYPLRLQLPPNNATMHVVVVESSSKAAGSGFTKTRLL